MAVTAINKIGSTRLDLILTDVNDVVDLSHHWIWYRSVQKIHIVLVMAKILPVGIGFCEVAIVSQLDDVCQQILSQTLRHVCD